MSSLVLMVCSVVHVGGSRIQAQETIASSHPVPIAIKAGESTAVLVPGGAGSIQVVELRLGGGLIHLQSKETTRRLLDLGRGGRLRFAVEIPESGTASLELASAERLRVAEVQVRLVPDGEVTPAQRIHLRDAGIAFARADSTRRHLPHAPDTATAMKEYDHTTREALLAGDSSLAQWALAQKARFLLYQKSNFQETKELLQNATALQFADDTATQALLYKTLSSCEYYLGDVRAAAADGEHALDLYRKTGDRYWQGIVLSNLISVLAELGRDTEAVAAAREALTDAEDTQDPAGVVFSLTELASLYRQQGELQPAFQAFREAQSWADDIRYAPLIQAQVEEALGSFYMEIGMWGEAEEQLKLSLRHTPGDSPTALQARGLLARAAEQNGNSWDALREYETALTDARRLKLPAEEAALLIGRSAAHLEAHQAIAAVADAHSAEQLAREQDSSSLRIEATLAKAAACRQGCKDISQAAGMYQEAIALIEDSGKREDEAIAYAGLAHIHAALGKPRMALDEVDHALSLLEHSRASLAGRDLAATLFTQRRSWYQFATDLSLRLDHSDPGQGFQDKAFRFTERARARAMLDALGEASSQPSFSIDPALAARIAANTHRIEGQEESLLTATDPKSVAAKLRTLYREQDSLEAERRAQQVAGLSLETIGLATVPDIQQVLLNDETALLSFTAGQNATYRWLITSSSRRVDTLPSSQELSKRFSSLQKALLSTRPSLKPGEDAAQYSNRLASFNAQRNADLLQAGALLLPILPSRIHRLYIVTDSLLPSLPWAALRIRSSSRVAYAIERYVISLEPSASVAVALSRRATPASRRGILVVSNTVPLKAQLALHGAALEGLPGSAREAHAIEQLTAPDSRRVLQGSQATVNNVRDALQSNLAIVHFATHTILIPNHPELSGMALSPGSSASASGVLWLRDIPRLHSPPIVVLSGCATQGSTFGGEELKTLTQAFYLAGAQQVIATSWDIDDDATVPLMQAFYRDLLQRNRNAADALRSAQLHRIQEHADLADWSAFVIDGVSTGTTNIESAAR